MKYGIFAICFASAIVSYVISMIPDRKNKEKKRKKLSDVVFYFLIYIFLAALFQCVTGDIKENFLDCFSEATYHTYLRYGVILIPCAVLVPVVYPKLFRQKADGFMHHFVNWFAVLFVPEYVIFLKNSTLLLCIQILLSAACGLASVFLMKETQTEKADIRKKAGRVIPCILWTGITYILFVPNQIVLFNLSQMPIRYSTIAVASVLMFFLYCAVCSVVGVLLSDRYSLLYTLSFFGLTLCGYIQCNFLNKQANVMDGLAVEYTPKAIWGNYAVWAVIMLAVYVVAFLLRKKAFAWYKYISIFFSITQLVAFASVLITADYGSQRTEALTCQYLNDVSKNENVVLFVMDRYDEIFIDKILENDKDFLEPLSDFTHYQNVDSEYGHTYMVLPYILTGVEWQFTMPRSEYAVYADENEFFMGRIKDLGYECDVYTDSFLVRENVGRNIRNWVDYLEMDSSTPALFKMWNKVSRYSILPFGIANDFYYTDYDFEIVMKGSGKYVWGDDTVIYRLLEKEGLTVSEDVDKLFKVIHMYGVHPPYYMNEQYEIVDSKTCTAEEQARASMRIVYRYIEEMKKSGVYDRATIIIMADHGKMAQIESDGSMKSVSVPMLFMKAAGETHEAMQKSDAPLVLHDLTPTLLRDMGDPSYQDYGRCYDEVPEDEQKTRYYYSGNPPAYTPYIKYQIDGNVHDISGWSVIDSSDG